MNTEELLRPRIKLIADWPGCEWAVGTIFPNNFADFKRWPHLFQELSWWQERDIKDMPEYVKHSNGEYYRHKYQFEKELYFDQECAGHWIGWTEVDKDFNNYTPVSKEEYTSSKQAK